MTTDEFLKEPYKIGFTEKFPVKEILKSYEITLPCRNQYVTFNIHIAKFLFGKNEEFSCTGIATDKVDISKNLMLGGFNSMCCYDEADTMRKGIKTIVEQLNLEISNEVCSWPFCKVIICKYPVD